MKTVHLHKNVKISRHKNNRNAHVQYRDANAQRHKSAGWFSYKVAVTTTHNKTETGMAPTLSFSKIHAGPRNTRMEEMGYG